MSRIVLRFLFGVLILFLAKNQSDAQSLHPDSLMLKVEQLGNYLLYRNHDTSYIENYGDKFTLKLIGVNKYNYFKVKDSKNDVSAKFRPDRKLNLGLGIAYKWFAFDLAFNFGIGEDSDFQNSTILDISGTIFSSKQFVNASYQYYYGYQMTKIKGIDAEELPNSSIRDDIRTVNFGLQYFFAFNYDKFSLKAPFIHNEMQKKSAGSFLLGVEFGIYSLSADSAIIPLEIHSYFDENLHLTDLNSTNVSFGFGYIYTFVFQKYFYATLSFIPAFGINLGDYKTDYRKSFDTHMYLGFKTMNSIGYNSDRIFGGIQYTNDFSKTRIEKQLGFQTSHGKTKLFLGYRFR